MTTNTSSELTVKEKQLTREAGTHEGPYFEPQVDIYERPDALVLVADIPGATADDIQTDLKDNLLTVSARVTPLEAKWRPLLREYQVGHYLRQFRLGQQIDQAGITASLRDGVLTLTLPKVERAKPRRVQVTVG